MKTEDVRALINWLSRTGDLDSHNEDLLEDAVFNLENGNNYRSERSLNAVADNFKSSGKTEAEKAVRRLL